MKIVHRSGCAAALALPFLLAGCSLLPATRHLPVPKTATAQSATPKELVNQINQRWDALNSMTAKVEIQATELKTAEGLEKDEPTISGYIVMRKPNQLRVVGTDFGIRIFDMASDGNQFTLLVPHDNTAFEGPNTVKEKSPNPLLNLRPQFFLDAIAVRGLDPGNEYMVAGDSETIEDPSRKHLYIEQEYTLSVMQPKGGPEKLPLRVITFHRDDMLPYDQDVYDSDGNLETQIRYSNYVEFTAGNDPSKVTIKYPSRITIKRPQEGIQLVLTVDDVQENIKDLTDDQFVVKIPDGTKIQRLK
jgi:outer membrane lipoprotein-sorting protein